MKGTQNKKHFIEMLKQLWEMYPEERFGQFLENHVFGEKDMFFKEDEETLKKIKEELGISQQDK